MRSGLALGKTASIDITVTREMFAQFEEELVHPVYSTVSMVYHMEWASRLIILPFLEDHEEGMGSAVSVRHLAPCAEGAAVRVTAAVSGLRGNQVVTRVKAENEGRTIGIGKITQTILTRERIAGMINGNQ
ncbi:thioesterase family protein [Peribacillus sp. SCS-37]|uniref:thioesterase family protein n=1 Tax=Paraperibacillus esterisolvens TaxID=3115296 RepID=UPI0039068ED9